jgi:PAS domain S-box-containing protein
MKGDKTSKNKLRKPAKGILKSKKEIPGSPKSGGRQPKLRNPMAIRKEAEEILKSKKGRIAISDITRQKQAKDEAKRFASFPQLNPNPVLEIDSSGTIVFCNAAAIQTLRKLNLRDTTIFLPNDISDILNTLKQENEAQFYREVKIKDRIFVEALYVTPQYNSIRIYANDVTERRQAEETLRHSEEYFRLLMENASDAVTILAGDGTIRYESLSVERMLGYKPEELVGTSAFDLIHPDDVPNAADALSQLLQKPGLTLYAEFRCRHKDGSLRILGATGRNFLDHPVIKGVIVNSRDITERTEAAEALRSERQKLINILDSMVDGIYIVDQKYNIEYVNPEIEKEYGPVNGRSCHEYFEGQKEACTWCKNQEIFKGKTVRWEWYSAKTNKTYDLVNTPLRNPDGSVSKLGIFRDITERKHAEEKLHKLNRTLRAISNSNHALVRATDEGTYLREVCRISVEDCGYAMVWVGFAENDEAKTVRPVASAGFEEGYLETLKITWADTERGRGPTGTAIRTGQASVCPNMLTDPDFLPWREQAIRRNYASSVVLPLLADGKAFGALNIYSREPDSFSEEEVKMLTELAGDFAFGIISLRLRTAHALAEQALRESREDLNRAQAVAQTGSWRLDVRRNELLWSDENHRIFGIPKGTPMTYETFLGTVHPEDREYVNRKWTAALRGEHYDIEHRIVVQGNIRWVRERAELEFDQDGSLRGGFGTTQDITERKNAEEALRKSEARYRSYLEVTGQVGWTTDADGLVVEDMPAWRQYTGQSREEIQVWGWSKVLHPDDLERTSEIWRKAVQEKRTYETEYRLRRHDGVYRHFLARGVPTFNEDGSIREWVGTCIDITERKQLEEDLRRSHDELEIRVQERTSELRKAYEGLKFEIGQREMAEKTIREQADILDSLFKDTITPLVLLDKDFNFIRVNGAYAKCCARDVSEFKGHNHFEFYPHEENEAIFKKVVETKVPFQVSAKPFVFPDHPEWGTSYWDWTLTPLLDADGEVTFLVFALNDVTERVKAEKEVEKNEALLRTVLETLPVGVWVIDENGNIVHGNPAGRQIWGGAQNVGIDQYGQYKGWWLDTGELIKPDEWSAARAIMKGETSLDEEIEIESFDGKHKIILSSTVPIRDSNGEIRGAIVVNRNITERKRMEDRIRATNNLLSLFVTKSTRKEYLDSVVDLVHEWTGCNCVGIRVLDKLGNIPYESYRGFSPEFWEAENWISAKNDQCVCSRIVLQKPDAQDWNMMTPNGTFYCNNTETFAGLLTEKDLPRYRGLCIRTGFKSLAIIPILYKGTVLGALHIADRREGMVPLEKIEFIETVTPMIGEAIFRFSAEEALMKSEARLSEAERIALLGNWEWDIANDSVSLSNELYQIFAKKPEEFHPTYESFLNLVHPDDLENVKDSIRKAVRERKPFDMDFRFMRNDGVVRVMHGRGEIMYDLSGMPLLVKGTGQDITDRVKAEKDLRESEERYRMLIETMNEGLGMDDENGLLVYANDRLCEMLGYSLDEIIGRPVLSFFDEKNQKIIQEQVEKRKGGENESYRLEWLKKDGQKIITLVSPRGIFNRSGKYKGSFAVITDVTEKLRLESIAEAVNTMDNIGFIFSGVRHEIGNPVNSIKMALSVLKQNLDSYSKEMIKEYADRMLSEIVRMEYLLKAMKSFNLFETMELVDVNMTTFMDNFLRLTSGDFAKKGIRIETDIPETLWAYIDPRALQQVLLNVMANASDALEGRENATITVRASKLGDLINITVEDNGSGMSEDQVEGLFKPFYTTKEKGTGLGLVISKKMMTKMKGLIEVVSEKNRGTIVDLFIPEGISEGA